jgi:hypothetical protein
LNYRPRWHEPSFAIAFHAAGGTGARADGIAAMQLHALKQHYSGKLKITDVKEMFVQMRDHV